jgi:hypothetical protein
MHPCLWVLEVPRASLSATDKDICNYDDNDDDDDDDEDDDDDNNANNNDDFGLF